MARVTAFADFATARIETLTAQEWAAFGPRTAAEVDLFRQACRDAGRLLTDVARLGLDQRALDQRREGAAAEVWAQRRVAEQAAAAVGRILARLGYRIRTWTGGWARCAPRSSPGSRAVLSPRTGPVTR